jgi:LuxR family maltose regulon positive regulatory protein
VFVRSPHAFADIRAIDTASAQAAPGVLAVLTAAALDATGIGSVSVPVPVPGSPGMVSPHRPSLARDCVRHVGDPIAHVGPNSVAAALPASLVAEIRYEQGGLDEAEAAVIDRLAIIDAIAMLECTLRAYIVLARIAACRKNIQHAYALLEKAENLGGTRRWGRLVAAALVERLGLNLAEGRTAEARACFDRLEQLAAEYPAPMRCAWSEIHYYSAMAGAQMAKAENRPRDAAGILAKLRREAEDARNDYVALRLGAQLSAVLLGANEPAEAANAFRRVLRAAAPAGIYQTILDQGPAIGNLLMRFQEDAKRTELSHELLPHLGSLIARWGDRYQPARSSGPSVVTAESLSEREHSVLEFIGQGHSNKEIARDLGITPETVKSHVKNIFAKLAVQRRAQAVSRAQSLGLIQDA